MGGLLVAPLALVVSGEMNDTAYPKTVFYSDRFATTTAPTGSVCFGDGDCCGVVWQVAEWSIVLAYFAVRFVFSFRVNIALNV